MENKVKYLIELAADNSQLKKDILSGNVDIKKVKQLLTATIESARKEANRLGADLKNGLNVDSTQLQHALELISGVADEMDKMGNPIKNWAKTGKKFYTDFTNMERSVAALAQNVSTLQTDLNKLTESFADFKSTYQSFDPAKFAGVSQEMGDVAKGAQNASKAVKQTVTEMGEMVSVSDKIDRKLQKQYDDIVKIKTELKKASDLKDTDLSDIYKFDDKKITERLNYLRKQIEDIGVKYTGDKAKNLAAPYIVEFDKIIGYIQKNKEAFSYFSKFPFDPRSGKKQAQSYRNIVLASIGDFNPDLVTKEINKQYEEIEKKYREAINPKDKSSKDKSTNALANQLGNVKLSLRVPKKSELVGQINKLIDSIQPKDLHQITAHVIPALDIDEANPIEDKKKRAQQSKNGPNPASDDAVTDTLVNKTKDRFKRIEDTVDESREKIVGKAEAWRKAILEKLQLPKLDLKFSWNGNVTDNFDKLYNDIQSYFDETPINIKINGEHFAKQIEGAINEKGLTLGGSGGTATIDANDIANVIKSIFTGEPLPVRSVDDEPAQKESDGKKDDDKDDEIVAQLNKEAAKGVIDLLKKLSNKAHNSKGGERIFDILKHSYGIDLDKINKYKNDDDEIFKILQKALMKPDERGLPVGGALGNDLQNTKWLKELGIKKGGSKSIGFVLEALGRNLNDLFDLSDVNTEISEMVEQFNKRKQIYDKAKEKTKQYIDVYTAFNKVGSRNSFDKYINNPELLSMEDIDKAISAVKAIGGDVKALQKLKDARLKLGNSEDLAAIKEFKDSANHLFDGLKEVSKWLLQLMGNFKGRVHIKGRLHSTPISGPYDMVKIPKDAVIDDLDVYSAFGHNYKDSKEMQSKPKRPPKVDNSQVKATQFSIKEGKESELTSQINASKSNIDAIPELENAIEQYKQSISELSKKINELNEFIEKFSINLPKVDLGDFDSLNNTIENLSTILSSARTALASSSDVKFDTRNLSPEISEDVKKLNDVLSYIHKKATEIEDINNQINQINGVKQMSKGDLDNLMSQSKSNIAGKTALQGLMGLRGATLPDADWINSVINDFEKAGFDSTALKNLQQVARNYHPHDDDSPAKEQARKALEEAFAKFIENTHSMFDKLQQEYGQVDLKKEQKKYDLYHKAHWNPDRLDNDLSSLNKAKNTIETDLTESQKRADLLIKKLSAIQNSTDSGKQNKAVELANKLREIRKALYDEAKKYVAIMHDKDADDVTKKGALTQLQQVLSGLTTTKSLFAKIGHLIDTPLYDKKKHEKDVEQWTKEFIKDAPVSNIAGDARRQVTDSIDTKQKIEEKLRSAEAQLKLAKEVKDETEKAQKELEFVQQYNKLLEKEVELLKEINQQKKQGDWKAVNEKRSEQKVIDEEIRELLANNPDPDRHQHGFKYATIYDKDIKLAAMQRNMYSKELAKLNAAEIEIKKSSFFTGKYGSKMASEYMDDLAETFYQNLLTRINNKYGPDDALTAEQRAEKDAEIQRAKKGKHRYRNQLFIKDNQVILKDIIEDEDGNIKEQTKTLTKDLRTELLKFAKIDEKREVIKKELEERKLDETISELVAQKQAAMRYGGVTKDELKKSSLVQKNDQRLKELQGLFDEKKTIDERIEQLPKELEGLKKIIDPLKTKKNTAISQTSDIRKLTDEARTIERGFNRVKELEAKQKSMALTEAETKELEKLQKDSEKKVERQSEVLDQLREKKEVATSQASEIQKLEDEAYQLERKFSRTRELENKKRLSKDEAKELKKLQKESEKNTKRQNVVFTQLEEKKKAAILQASEIKDLENEAKQLKSELNRTKELEERKKFMGLTAAESEELKTLQKDSVKNAERHGELLAKLEEKKKNAITFTAEDNKTLTKAIDEYNKKETLLKSALKRKPEVEQKISETQDFLKNSKDLLQGNENTKNVNKKSAEEVLVIQTENLVKQKTRLLNIEKEIEELTERRNKAAKGSAEREALQHELDAKMAKKEEIDASLKGIEKSVSRLKGQVQYEEKKDAQKTTTKDSKESIGKGGLLGAIKTAVKEGVSGFKIDTSNLATEDTLSNVEDTLEKIHALLGGDGDWEPEEEQQDVGVSRNKKDTVDLHKLLVENPAEVLKIAKSDPERVKKELFSYIENYMTTTKSDASGQLSFAQGLQTDDFMRVLLDAAYPREGHFHKNAGSTAPLDTTILGNRLMDIGTSVNGQELILPPLDIMKNSGVNGIHNLFQAYQIITDIVDTVYPNQMPKLDVSQINQTALQEYSQNILKDLLEQVWHAVRKQAISDVYKSIGKDEDAKYMASQASHYRQGVTSLMSLLGVSGISEGEFLAMLMPPIMGKTKTNKRGKVGVDYQSIDSYESLYIQNAYDSIMKSYQIPGLNAPLDLGKQTKVNDPKVETSESQKQLEDESKSRKELPDVVRRVLDQFIEDSNNKKATEGIKEKVVETSETSKQLEDEKAKTAEIKKQSKETSKSAMTIGKAIKLIEQAIGKSKATTAIGMAKAYESKIYQQGEVADAAKFLYNTPDNKIKTNTGRDIKKKLTEFRNAFVSKQNKKPKVPVEPEIKPGAVAKEVKENVVETPAEAEVKPTKKKSKVKTDSKSSSDQSVDKMELISQKIEGMAKRLFELENENNPDTQEERKLLQEQLATMKAMLSNDEDKSTSEDDKVETSAKTDDAKSAPAQGGLIGLMRTHLAQENTLKQVLNKLGEIAKNNAMSGKPNNAQGLLEQFRRMLEADAWEGRERVAYMDLATGSMSNTITGDNESISAERLRILREAYADKMDMNAKVHTHAGEDDPYFSEIDLKQAGLDFAAGIKQQILLSDNNMSVLDMTGVKDVNGLLDALTKTEHNFESLAATADKFGAKYVSKAFSELTPQALVKMLGIKGIESKLNESETKSKADESLYTQDAKEAASIIQKSTGESILKTAERYGAELRTVTETVDAKGNKKWTVDLANKYEKAMIATNKRIAEENLKNQFGGQTDARKIYNSYLKTYEELQAKIQEFKSAPEDQKAGLQADIDKLQPKLDKLEEKLISLIKRKEKFLGDKGAITTFNKSQIGNAGVSLRELMQQRHGDNINMGENIATRGLSETDNGARLIFDVLKNGQISSYALEVDRVTGQVKEFMLAENALANAFLNVNKAMQLNETVIADIAGVTDMSEEEMRQFLATANSPELNAYKKAMQDMQTYTQYLWVDKKGNASQEELQHLMALSERVIQLGKNAQKTSLEFQKLWTNSDPSDIFAADIDTSSGNRNQLVKSELEKIAQGRASGQNKKYDFVSFDNDKLRFKLTDVAGQIEQVTLEWSELYKTAIISSDKSVVALDPLVQKIEDYKQKIADAKSAGYLFEKSDETFNQAIQEIVELEQKVKDGTASFEELEEARKKAIGIGSGLDKTITSNRRQVGTNAVNSVKAQYDKIVGSRSSDLGITDDIAIVKQYNSARQELLDKYDEYVKTNQHNNPQIQEQLRQQAAGVQKLGRELLKSTNEAEKLQQAVNDSGTYTNKQGIEKDIGGTRGVSVDEAKNISTTLQTWAKELYGVDLQNVKVDATTKKLTGTLRVNNRTVKDVVIQYNAATEQAYAFEKAERESLSGFPAFMKGLKEKTKAIAQYLFSMTSIYRVIGEVRKGIQYIREIDKALVELRKVTDETSETYDKFLSTASKTADRLGSTISAVTEATATFAKLGYSMELASEMAESAIVYKNVGDNIASTEDAANSIISTLKGFGLEASESMRIVDRFNEVGNRFAITSQGLGEALRLSASALNEGGNTLDEAIGIITAANEVVNDPSSVGTALKTLTLRLRGSKTELEEMGEDVSDMATTTSQLQAKLLALTGGQVDIMLDENTFKSSTQILREMAAAWEDMNDIQRASALELMGGKRQANVLSALIQNFDTAERAIKASAESTGSALRENEVYLDSIQGRIDLFTNSVQSMWKNALDSDTVKWFVNAGTDVIKVIDGMVDSIGLLNTAIVGFGAYSGLKILFSTLKAGGVTVKSLTTSLWSFLTGVKATEVASVSLTQAQLTEKLILNGLTKESAQAIVTQTGLGVSTDKLTKETLKAAMATEGYAASQIKSTQASIFGGTVTDAFRSKLLQYVIGCKSAEEATEQLEIAKYKLKLAEMGLEDGIASVDDVLKAQMAVELASAGVDITKITTTELLSLAMKKLGKNILKAAKTFAPLIIAAGAIWLVTKAVDWLIKTTEELKEEYDELNNTLSETESKLSNLESQLSDINNQIKEINSQDSLSFTDEEELDRLKAQRAELQRQIDLYNTLKEQQQVQMNGSALTMANNYENVGVNSGKTTAERSEGWGKAGAVVGGVGVGIAGAMGAGASIGIAGGPIGLIVGAIVGAIAGAIIGVAGGAVVGELEPKVGESLDNIKEQHEKLLNDFNEARDKYQKDPDKKNKKKFDEAQKALQDYEAATADYLSNMDSYYSQMDWKTATTEQRKAMQEFYDKQDEWAISSGASNAKSNALNRIFGENAEGGFAKARDEINKIKEKLKEAQNSGDELAIAEALSKLENFKFDVLSEEEVARLREMGIYLYEVEDYFKDAAKAESEFKDAGLYDVAKDIDKITDGLESLKTAFDEIIERGSVTAKTITDLYEQFRKFNETDNGTDAWFKYSNAVFSGTASIEEMTKATEEYVQAWLQYELAENNLKPENKWTYIIQLQNLGVENAQEYVEDMLQTNMVKEIEKGMSIDVSKVRKKFYEKNGRDSSTMREWNSFSEEKIQELATQYGILSEISDEEINKIAERYNVEKDAIQNIIDKLNEKQNLENQIAEKQKEQEAYNEWRNGKDGQKGFKALEEEIEALKEKLNGFNPDDWDYSFSNWWDGKGNMLTEEEYDELKTSYDKFQELKKQYDALWKQGEEKGYIVDGKVVDPNFKAEIDGLQSDIDDITTEIETELTANVQLELNLQEFDEGVDRIQDVYSTLKDITTEYNTQGYLSLDNLQALLNLSPEYLAVLQMENGQLTINQQALQTMLETKLDDAEATAVQTAITQLSALAERKQAIEISNSAVAANQASIQLGTYSSALGTVAQDAIVAAGSVAAFNAALQGAQGNEFVSDDEINQVLTNFNNSVNLIDSVRSNLSSNFNSVLDPGSKTSPEEVAESEWDRLVARYERELALITNERDLIQAEIDKAEARGGQASAQYYQDLIRNSNEEKALLEEKKNALDEYLRINGSTVDPETWTEYNNEINETAVAIKECTTNILEYFDALEELNTHYFEQVTDEVSRLGEEIEFVQGLLEDEDIADENGNWTSAGITSLGLYVNEMERAVTQAEMYKQEIGKVDASWSAYQGLLKQYGDADSIPTEELSALNDQYGYVITSAEEYEEKNSELTDSMYSEIDAYNSAKDGIVELNEARIDAIKEGIEKEIEAYEDYIDVVKETLDAERDLYDFKKNVQKQTKDIAALERRIASLSGSTNASDIAERRKLQAELNEAREGLNDTYYDHAKDAQSNALDDEAEAFSKSKEKYIEELEKQLEDTETLIQNSMMDVLLNADSIYAELNGIADAYGITLSAELTQPWKDASAQAITWKDELKNSMESGEYATLIGEGGAITAFANGVATKLTGSWNSAKTAAQQYVDFLTKEELGSTFEKTITGFGDQIQNLVTYWENVRSAAEKAHTEQERKVTVGGNESSDYKGESDTDGNGYDANGIELYSHDTKNLQKILNAFFKAHIDEDGLYGPNTKKAVKVMQKTLGVTENGKYDSATERALKSYMNARPVGSWFRENNVTIPAKMYAKGTIGTSRDGLAVTDESWIGEEITLAAGKNGQLQYLKKGSAVMPADISANLVEWGKLNPDMMKIGGGANINMISNAVTKPNFELNFEALVKADRIDEGTLPEVKKFVQQEINNLVKQMNYALRGKGAR